MKNLKILGSGCPKCNKLAERTKEAADRLEIPYEMEKVTEIDKIMSYGVIGVEYLILRIVAVFILAIGSGILIERLVPVEEMDEGTPICQLCKSCTSPGATGASASGLIAGWNLMIYLLPYIFIGLIIGAVIATFVPVVMISKYVGITFSDNRGNENLTLVDADDIIAIIPKDKQ